MTFVLGVLAQVFALTTGRQLPFASCVALRCAMYLERGHYGCWLRQCFRLHA